MKTKTIFANGENHLFLAIKKLEFESFDTGFNSVCLQVKGWNFDNENEEKPNVIITFDSPENEIMKIKDVTKQVRNSCGYLEIVPLIKAIKKGEI